MSADDPLKKLGLLMGGEIPPGVEELDDEALERQLREDTNDILKLAIQKCDGNIFDVQVLIESAAEAVRDQIRELVEEDDGN